MIEVGNLVKVHYTLKLGEEIIDSSIGNNPLEFKVGGGDVIKGFDNAVLGLVVGDIKDIILTPEEGYGELNEELLMPVPKTSAPADVQIGSELQGIAQNGQPFTVIVVDINDDNLIVDANHPLAGKDLNFNIEIVEVN